MSKDVHNVLCRIRQRLLNTMRTLRVAHPHGERLRYLPHHAAYIIYSLPLPLALVLFLGATIRLRQFPK